jgi:hypothetical protein
MGIPIASNFDLSSGLPLDSRTIVDTRVNRDLIPAIQRFEGLSVFVTDENTTYQLHNGITNADWVALIVGSAPTLSAVTDTGNETIQPIVFGTEDGTVQKQIGIGDIATAGFYQLNLPNDNNTLVTSVNGTAADINGNIEIGSLSSENFANTDLTATDNRFHWFNYNNLNISGINDLQLESRDASGTNSIGFFTRFEDRQAYIYSGTPGINNYVTVAPGGISMNEGDNNYLYLINGGIQIGNVTGIQINNTNGTSGQVLTSQGDGLPVIWADAGGSGTVPTLQQVMGSGNTTTSPLILENVILYFRDTLTNGSKFINGSFFNASSFDISFSLPDVGGTIPISVNGIGADSNGNIEIGSSPITIVNGNSLFSTGLSAGSGSDAIYSVFLGVDAGNQATNASVSNFIGTEAGLNATRAFRSNFFGISAGSGASDAFRSNFFGEVAGADARNANNSNFFGSGAGNNATEANESNFIGSGAGQQATNANYSNFFGSSAGGQATNAANSIFIGRNAGYTDSVDNTANYNLSSILIGNYNNTGGFSNSILLGSGADGSPIANTKPNQFMLADTITDVRWRGIEYTLPSSQAANAGDVLSNDGAGVLSWVAGGGGGGGAQDNIMRVVQVTLAEIGMTISDTDEDIKQALANYIEGSVIPEDEIWYFQITDYPGGATIFVEINLTNLLTLVTSNTLIPGAVYKITGVDSNLYGGTTIFLKALSTNTLEKSGHGLFYNPKYDQALTTDGIWDNISTFVTSSVVGTFGPNEIITADNGATGVIYSTISSNKFVVLTGDWLTATSITGNDTSATANIASVVLKTYSIDDNVIWGGKHWANVNGNVGAATNALNLNEEWAVIPYDDVNYNVVYDPIEYDLATDIILKRTDSFGNEVEATADDRAYFTSQSYVGSPINVFQWGNQYVSSTNRGTGANKINSGYAESVNNIGSFFANEVKSRSVIQGNATFTSKINLNRLSDFSQIRANVLNNGVLTGNFLHQGSTINPFSASTINSNTLNSGEIKENLLRIKCTINNNTLTSSFIFVNNLFWSNINFNVMSNSAAIFSNNLDYLCTINSNTMSAAVQIVSNIMNRSSFINSNIMSATNAFIGTNQMYSNVTIASNTLSGSSASIFQNILNACYIQNNVLSGNFADIHSNTLLFPEPRVALSVRSSIQNNTLSITNAKIQSCLLKYNARIQNVTISTNNVRVRSLTIDDEYVDLNNVPLLRNYQYNEIGIKQRFFIFDVVFDGGAGTGLIGSITLPNYPIAAGFYIDSLEVDVNAGLTGVGGIINLGIGTDAPQSGLNDTTGDIATLNSTIITRIQNTTFTKATVLRNIVMEVKGANITAGTLSVRVNLKKF